MKMLMVVGVLVVVGFAVVLATVVLVPVRSAVRVGGIGIQNAGFAVRGARIEVFVNGASHTLDLPYLARGETVFTGQQFQPPISQLSGSVEVRTTGRRLGIFGIDAWSVPFLMGDAHSAAARFAQQVKVE